MKNQNETITKIDALLARVAQLSDEVRRLRASISQVRDRAPSDPMVPELVGMWIDGCCERGDFVHPRVDLHDRFAGWLERGESVSNQAFYRELTARGFVQHKSNGERYVVGLRPRSVDNSACA
jgi:hypothetical protein